MPRAPGGRPDIYPDAMVFITIVVMYVWHLFTRKVTNWLRIQRSLFPWLDEELGELTDKDQQLVTTDVVTAISALIHVEAKRQSFQEFYRVLKHEGRLSIFEIPARFNGLKHVY